jgi:hypothetical protein
MKKIVVSGILIIFFTSITGCNLSFQNLNPTPFFPTPNYTMTALFSVDENLVTNTPQDFAINTAVPVLPTVQPTTAATVAPTQVVPTNTASPTMIPPTNTSLPPTATKTEMPIRGGTWVSGKYMKTPPVFDSVWDEWEATKYPAKHVVFGANNWKDSDDLEGSFAVGWNETYLYLAVKVIDDIYAQNATGQDIYKGDSIEILLDTNLYGDLSTTSLNSDDFQIGISPGKGSIDGETEAYLWFPSNKAGGLDDVIIASSRSNGVYRVEIGIPWKVFGITPTNGQQLGFGLSISDNDDTSQNVQQSMVSNLPYRSLLNPTTWTVLTLVK